MDTTKPMTGASPSDESQGVSTFLSQEGNTKGGNGRRIGFFITGGDIFGNAKPDEDEDDDDDEVVTGTPTVNRFGRDLTAEALAGKLDPVLGRDVEIDRLIEILCRRKKSNPLILGDPGVGKTSLVEGLAQRIVGGLVPDALRGARVVELSMNALVSGTSFRGEFEERMTKLVSELEANPEVIVFIDELHTIVGAGGAKGSSDAANILKPALSRGQMRCIGATTADEYRRHIERDGALSRRFQPLDLQPLGREETLAILQRLVPAYEAHHRVSYSMDALGSIVDLSERYIFDRVLPDKAIDLMDEVGARTRRRHIIDVEGEEADELTAEPVEELRRKIEELREQVREAILAKNQDLISHYHALLKQHQEELERADGQARGADLSSIEITPDMVAETVASMTGIPSAHITSGELAGLKGLEETIARQIIGQQDAVAKVTRAIKRNRMGLGDPNRPIGTFLLMGPTGVGKTYLARLLAQELFGTEEALIRIDMNEMVERHNSSRLVGTSPGYVGYEDGGQLTNAIRKRPYAVVLLDEIEKAHPEVDNMLLQLLDEGVVRDGTGKQVSFRNTVIIMTSNVGARQARSLRPSVGFTQRDDDAERSAVLQKALQGRFSPEFLGRLDEIIEFSPLGEAEIRQIVALELDKIRQRILEKGYLLEVDDEAIASLAQMSVGNPLGARPLRRILQREIEDRVVDLLIETEPPLGRTIRIKRDKSGLLTSALVGKSVRKRKAVVAQQQ